MVRRCLRPEAGRARSWVRRVQRPGPFRARRNPTARGIRVHSNQFHQRLRNDQDRSADLRFAVSGLIPGQTRCDRLRRVAPHGPARPSRGDRPRSTRRPASVGAGVAASFRKRTSSGLSREVIALTCAIRRGRTNPGPSRTGAKERRCNAHAPCALERTKVALHAHLVRSRRTAHARCTGAPSRLCARPWICSPRLMAQVKADHLARQPAAGALRKRRADPGAYRKQGDVWIEGVHLCSALLAHGGNASQAVITEWPGITPYREIASQAETVLVVSQR